MDSRERRNHSTTHEKKPVRKTDDHTWRTEREEKGELRCNSALCGIWNIRRHQNDQNTVGKDDRRNILGETRHTGDSMAGEARGGRGGAQQ